MKRFHVLTSILLFSLLLTGCAGTYKRIYPPAVNYSNNDVSQGISFSYRYDVLRERGNRKFAKKETMRGVKVVAVRLTNNYDFPVTVGRDINFYSGENLITVLDPFVAKQMLKQSAPTYLLYLLMTPLTFNIINSQGRVTDSYPIGLILGPGIAAGNVITASSANGNLFRDLSEYNIMGKDIRPGETVYGLLAISQFGYDPISIRFTETIDVNKEIGMKGNK
ncbi:MAG TPA: hypothetical protein VK212_10545 [Lentimicrobium sp.]|nr:hypothetical protein [Lentimicrobium sp.]